MRQIVFALSLISICGCAVHKAPKPVARTLAPGEKTANHTVELSIPHAFIPYATAWAECDHWIHMDFDAMHENVLDLNIKRKKSAACQKAMALNPTD